MRLCRMFSGAPIRSLRSSDDQRPLEQGSRKRRRRGVAAVEFAIVALIFFLLVFGIMEYGRMVMAYQVLNTASCEGARVATLDGVSTQDVEDQVETYLTGGGITGATITVSPNPPSTAAYGDPITVTISVPFSSVSWLPTPLYLGAHTMIATSVMRRETIQ